MAISQCVIWIPGPRIQPPSQDDFIADVVTGARDFIAGVQSPSANRCARLIDYIVSYNATAPGVRDRWDAVASILFHPDRFCTIVDAMVNLAMLREMIRISGDPSGIYHNMIDNIRISIIEHVTIHE